MKRILGYFAVLFVVLGYLLAPSAASAQAGVTADVRATVTGKYEGAAGIGTPKFPLQVNGLLRLSPGTGTGKADKLYAAERTLAASATENLDLAGALTDPLGASLTFVKVKTVLVIAACTNTNNVVVGGAASNGFVGPFADATDKVVVQPCGVALLTHPGVGWTVTPSTGDLLLVANSSSGTAVSYRVLILGTSV